MYRERLIRIAEQRYVRRGWAIPVNLGARLIREGVLVAFLR